MAVIIISWLTIFLAQVAELQPLTLKCECCANPLGVEATQPRLSWQIASDGANILQTAYQILVATSSVMAAAGQGDVWNSGRISSSHSIVFYDGPALKPTGRYYWSVKVWGNQGHISNWAEPAWWEMGLLDVANWSGAQWITGADSPATPLLSTAFNVATTAWEQWDCVVPQRSRDHAFLGSVDVWFYKYLGGIQPAEPGYKIINIHPYFPSGLTWVSAAVETPQGLVSSTWKRENDDLIELTIEIPPNARADVSIPGNSSSLRFGSGRHTLRFKISTLKSEGSEELL